MVKKAVAHLSVSNVLHSIDVFQEPIPMFNVNGKSSVSSFLGGIFTLVLFSIVLTYATHKFIHLESKKNPVISEYHKANNFDPDEVLNLNERNFRIAFAVEGFRTNDLKIDPRYVKWIVRQYGKKEGKEFEKLLDYHVCTDEDYDAFYPIIESEEKQLQQIRETENRGFLCLDWDDQNPLEIYGESLDTEYQRLEAVITPCNYIHDYLQDNGDTIHPDCIYDRDEQFEYVKQIAVLFMYNNQRFDPEQFGKDSIIAESKIVRKQVRSEVPNWVKMVVNTNSLDDETEFFQYG